ncbi:STAS domain-containing protein [Kibdelosporangium phytohabitans]|uniref:Anti-anti-sigma factor n=1 Tax=Kibdelosporangium phytohabitans TaxID=860235 RepID=A0A0N9I6W9_9PSEU|nr:STAS domain-containing protein [Kibdelosporangium phytohabitans]ALG11809.1 anti-anti-sigma factor [Kibdelosporangium phytohabitans]MBE1463222.1 rsbT antagonist protein RsbS [Kibdelosporangium phytohabitans]
MTAPGPARVPILRLGDVLLTGLLDDLDDKSAVQFTEELVERIAAEQIRGVVVDISRLQIIDSFVARVLTEMASTGQLLGAQVIVAGMRPAVAITLSELGLELTGVHTALNAEQAMAKLGWGRHVTS